MHTWWSTWHGKLGLRKMGLIEEVAPGERKDLSELDLGP